MRAGRLHSLRQRLVIHLACRRVACSDSPRARQAPPGRARHGSDERARTTTRVKRFRDLVIDSARGPVTGLFFPPVAVAATSSSAVHDQTRAITLSLTTIIARPCAEGVPPFTDTASISAVCAVSRPRARGAPASPVGERARMSSREELLLLRVVRRVADEAASAGDGWPLHRLRVVVVAIEAQVVRHLHHGSRLTAVPLSLPLVTRLAGAHFKGAVRRATPRSRGRGASGPAAVARPPPAPSAPSSSPAGDSSSPTCESPIGHPSLAWSRCRPKCAAAPARMAPTPAPSRAQRPRRVRPRELSPAWMMGCARRPACSPTPTSENLRVPDRSGMLHPRAIAPGSGGAGCGVVLGRRDGERRVARRAEPAAGGRGSGAEPDGPRRSVPRSR